MKLATTVRTIVLSAAVLMPFSAIAAPSDATLSPDRAVTTFHGKAPYGTLPNWRPPARAITIFDTLGTKPYKYDQNNGWTISNAGSQAGGQQWFAFAVQAKVNATITDIVEAVTNDSGTSEVTIALLADNNNLPGTVLQQKTIKKLQKFGGCCAVAVDKVTGVQVTAGTFYWVAAILPAKQEATTWDVWNYSTVNTNSGASAFYTANNGGWTLGTEQYSAFAIYGK